jgi:hypothetical protein
MQVRTKGLNLAHLNGLTARRLIVRQFAQVGIVIFLELRGEPRRRYKQNNGSQGSQENKTQEKNHQETTSMHVSTCTVSISLGKGGESMMVVAIGLMAILVRRL